MDGFLARVMAREEKIEGRGDRDINTLITNERIEIEEDDEEEEEGEEGEQRRKKEEETREEREKAFILVVLTHIHTHTTRPSRTCSRGATWPGVPTSSTHSSLLQQARSCFSTWRFWSSRLLLRGWLWLFSASAD